MAKQKESKLEKLKKDYLKIQKKYNLPEFDKLNQDFSIEKTADSETDFLIREVRKLIAEKMSGYLRFTEMLLNPTNAPIFVFSIIKNLGVREKKELSEMYKKMAKNEIKLIEIDIEFSEEKEAEFIKDSYKLWQRLKRDFLNILNAIEKNWDNKFEVNRRDYFG